VTAEKIPSVDFVCCMQAVCGDKCVDVSTDLGYSSLSKEWGATGLWDKAKLGRPVAATTRSHQKCIEEMIRENR